MKYKVGDKVKIKSLDWYNENKSKTGYITFNYVNFMPEMSRYCGEILTINQDVEVFGQYIMSECGFLWTDEMIECLVERNGKIYPYKIGDRVILKGNNRRATITDLKYNSWGNLSYYIKIDNDKDISVDYPTNLLLPYDNIVEDVANEPRDKMVSINKACEWLEKHYTNYMIQDLSKYVEDVCSFDIFSDLLIENFRKAMEE